MSPSTPAKVDSSDTTWESWFKQADLAITNGALADALELLDRAIAEEPTSPAPWQKKAFIFRKQGRHEEALACLEPISRRNGRNTSVLMDMAASHKALGHNEQSLAIFRSVIETDDQNKGAWLGIIDCTVALAKLSAALKHTETADTKLPGEFAFGLKRGAILRSMGRKREAVEQLQALLIRFPDTVQVQLALAIACREASLFMRANEQYEKILNADETNKAAWLGVIDTAIARGENGRALNLVKQAAEHLGDDTDLGLKQGVVLQKNGRHREAITHLSTLAHSWPENITVQLTLTLACLQAEDIPLYQKQLVRLQQLSPNDPVPYLRLAALANAQGNWHAAVEQSVATLTLAPDHIDAEILLARGYLGMGEVARAETILSDLLNRSTIAPDAQARACVSMAQVKRVKGDIGSAISYLLRARTTHQHNPAIIMELIMLSAVASREHEIGGMLDDLVDVTRHTPNERLAIMLAEYGRLDEALTICRAWQKLFPELEWLARMIACLAELSGNETAQHADTTSTMRTACRREEKADLPRYQFRHILHATWQPPSDPATFTGTMPPSSDPSVYAVAWSHCQIPGLSYTEWKRRADHATRTWMTCDNLLYKDPNQLDALLDFMDDDSLSALEPLARSNKPCFIVSSHMGVPAQIWFLSRKIPQFHYLSGWANKSSEELKPPFNPLITSLNNIATVRSIRNLIGSGGILGASIDAPFVALNPQYTSGYSYGMLCGQKFRISNLVPRLARRLSVPTMWVQPVWKNRRVVIEVEEIKASSNSLSEEHWLDEWTTAYLARLERLITRAPENLNLRSASVWRYLHAKQE